MATYLVNKSMSQLSLLGKSCIHWTYLEKVLQMLDWWICSRTPSQNTISRWHIHMYRRREKRAHWKILWFKSLRNHVRISSESTMLLSPNLAQWKTKDISDLLTCSRCRGM
uniref:Uncharacterized protein n=1 Tax=Opuntia streptacantha TaxID=393608 RepID=A0A7C9CPD7_OPUST